MCASTLTPVEVYHKESNLNQGVTTHDIRFTKDLDIRLISG